MPAALFIGACGGWGTAGAGCGVILGPTALPDELSETSGVAPSLRTPGAYWTHSDRKGEAVLWAVDESGAVRQRNAPGPNIAAEVERILATLRVFEERQVNIEKALNIRQR